jgi:hypothetical protein
MDICWEDCFALPIPQIASSGGKSFNHGGISDAEPVVAGFEAQAAKEKPKAKTKRIKQIFFILKLLKFIKRHTPLFGNISQIHLIFKYLK